MKLKLGNQSEEWKPLMIEDLLARVHNLQGNLLGFMVLVVCVLMVLSFKKKLYFWVIAAEL